MGGLAVHLRRAGFVAVAEKKTAFKKTAVKKKDVAKVVPLKPEVEEAPPVAAKPQYSAWQLQHMARRR